MIISLTTAVLIAIGIICVTCGVYFVTAYLRDKETGETEETLADTLGDTVNDILNSTLTDEQKLEALLKLLDLDDSGTDWGKIILPATLIIGVAMVLSSKR